MINGVDVQIPYFGVQFAAFASAASGDAMSPSASAGLPDGTSFRTP
jgi:hypothetical protein